MPPGLADPSQVETERIWASGATPTIPSGPNSRAIAPAVDGGTLGDALPGPNVNDPSVCVISTEELQSLVFTLGSGLSELEAEALRLYLEGESYEQMAEDLGCDTKTIDNALQRVKRKILTHQKSRQVLL